MEAERDRSVQGFLLTPVIDTLSVGIRPVGENDCPAILPEEREVDLKVTRRPAGNGTDVPVITAAASSNDVLADLSCKNPRLIPYARDAGDEVVALLLAHIV